MANDYDRLVQDWLRDFDRLGEEMQAAERAAFLRSEAAALLLYALPKDSEVELLWKKIDQDEEVETAFTHLLEMATNRLNDLLSKESLTVYQASVVASVQRRKLTTEEWIRRSIRNGRLPATKVGRSYFIRREHLLPFLARNPT